jgi:twitching motility protein PilT
MRDAETIQMALTAAETGHLVLSTIHAPSAASAIERIVDCYAPERQRQIRVQLAQCLEAILCQRLIATAGETGRVPAVEFLRNNYAFSTLIRDGRTAQLYSTMQTNAENGSITLETVLARMVNDRKITRKVALENCNNEAALTALI